MRLLREAAPEADVQASVRNACLLIQPSCGMDTYQAAIAGALYTYQLYCEFFKVRKSSNR